jgi:ABC-type nitrate/sulfonate/bicarbonate transport system ATPase subunit
MLNAISMSIVASPRKKLWADQIDTILMVTVIVDALALAKTVALLKARLAMLATNHIRM